MKKIRKLLCMAVAAATMLSMSVSASAEIDNDSGIMLTETVANAEPDEEGYVLVSENTYTDENGVTVTLRSYVRDTGIDTLGSVSKGSDIIETAEYKVGVTKWVTLWVEGKFAWDSDANRATVQLLDQGYKTHVNADVISNPPVSMGDDQGGNSGGNRYAFLEKKITMKGGTTVGVSSDKHEFRLRVEVNSNGIKSVKT